ncbi:CpsB/CapC family capsule biosynthesis tyrosine phosphatase [Filibacter tadaridae]|uniref:Tyrosine-protein phosphatase n=1 Tax=Filibacter tadaridae TaxID=2483811 RepID=A0A3P5XFZ8_9BACL|nr:CpsB/CapC family capsule biosynthesis tyrosine phosphatase [Filibacter tadaridae]VDC33681.1 Tyrosine-protein phosphatase YwqE [Filibacter tadaridae]
MIDMHTHILFGVDDGPETIEDTMRMLEKAASEGITDIIATSHAFNPHYHVPRTTIEGQLTLLADAVQSAGIPVKLHPGQEVRLCEDLIEKIEAEEALLLANSNYLLLELPTQSVPAYTTAIIQSLLEKEIIPIIAHPERNRAIAEKPARLERLVRNGALAQITAGSVAGHFGKTVQKISLQLIESNLIHTYGSDVHNLDTRPFLFEKGLNLLEKKRFHAEAELLLANNERILTNDTLVILEPELIIPKKWWNIKK